jgi:hypothetical protein
MPRKLELPGTDPITVRDRLTALRAILGEALSSEADPEQQRERVATAHRLLTGQLEDFQTVAASNGHLHLKKLREALYRHVNIENAGPAAYNHTVSAA